MTDITNVLARIEAGDAAATEQLLPLVYEELRKLAAAKLAHEKPGQTLQATALVHEAYLRLVGQRSQDWDSRSHFFAAAAESMRQILVNNAIRKKRPKHGGDRQRIELDEGQLARNDAHRYDEILQVHEALGGLASVDAEAAEIVKLRYFVGLSIPEIADVLQLSPRSVDRRWAYARAWLHEALQPNHGSESDS